MNVTIKELARLCGVSEGTVDRALHNRPGIHPETRDRILSKARELQYRPNVLAQSLAKGTTMSIGIVCFDLQNNLFASLVDSIETAAKEKGYFINLVLTHAEPQKELNGIRYLAERKIDGLVIFPVGKGEKYEAMIRNLKIPVVSVYNRISGEFPYVGVDDYQVFRHAVLHLAEKGYEEVMFSTVDYSRRKHRGINVYALERRQAGFLQGYKEAGFAGTPTILEGRGFPGFREALEKSGRKTAVLCICDTYALDLLDFCRKNNFSVPKDVGIMGYDNIDLLEYVQPHLATVEYNVKRMGEKLVEVLCRQMRGEKVLPDSFMEYRFVDGESI